MLPRDSQDELTRIKIWGFEMALEDVLACNPTTINKFYRIQKDYRSKRLDLTDALEQSCLILMADGYLLDAFCDIPRAGYMFKTIFDCNLDMWLLIRLAGGDVISRRLGGGVGRQSGECLLHLPHVSKAYGDTSGSISQNSYVVPEQTKTIMPGTTLTVNEQRYEGVTTNTDPGVHRGNEVDSSVKEVHPEPSISSQAVSSEGSDLHRYETQNFEEHTKPVE